MGMPKFMPNHAARVYFADVIVMMILNVILFSKKITYKSSVRILNLRLQLIIK